MPTNNDPAEVSNYTGVFRLASPSSSDPNHHRRIVKRNRQVVSCAPCRARKLKCDRQQPCAACVRRHDGDACWFAATRRYEVERRTGGGNGRAGEAEAEGEGEGVMKGTLAVLQDLMLELVQARERGGETGKEVWKEVAVTAEFQAMLGGIRDLERSVEATQNPAPSSPASSSRPLEQARQPRPSSDRALSAPETSVTTHEIMARLPPRPECDGLLTLYFQQAHTIPVLLHSGQFQRAYEQFWHRPEGTSLLWVSMLFCLLASSVFQQASQAPGVGDGLDGLALGVRQRIAGFSSMAYRCLVAGEYLGGKAYSVEAALLYGMHLVLLKREAEPLCWHTIETAVRVGQRMGYHRGNSGVSPFDAEMRRRTWACLEYFDVLNSFQQGIPPITRSEDTDTTLPSNLRDEEFNEDSTVLPPARSSLDYTPVLGAIHTSRQIKLLRQVVVQQALAATPPSYGDVRLLNADLRSLHDHAVPPSLRYRPVRDSGFADPSDVIVRRLLCEALYLKTVCVLHRRYLATADDDVMYEGSRQACREAALRLLDLQAEFDEHSGEGGRLYEKRYVFANPTGYYDFLLAAMCVCFDLIAGSKQDSPHEHERKTTALAKARSIWRKTAPHSKEAARATSILTEMLAKVSQGAAPLAGDGGERFAAAAAETAASSALSRENNASSSARPTVASEAPSSWAAVNASGRLDKAPASYSADRSHAWVDDLGKPRDRTLLGGALGGLLAGNVDWNRIDSFLLGREHTTGTSAMPASQSENANSSQRPSRDGWPYPSYKEREPNEAGTAASLRTWGRPLAGITIGSAADSISF